MKKEMLKLLLGRNKVLLFNTYREQIYSSSKNKNFAVVRSAYQYDGKELKKLYERKE